MLASDVIMTGGGKTATAYSHILEDIVTGHRAPGEAIDREAVAKDLGISVQPVTTAIDLLCADGFVDIRLQKGSFVAPIRLSRMIEAIFTISSVMQATCRFVQEKRDPATMRALDQAIASIREQAERLEFRAMLVGVRAYRDTMVAASHMNVVRAEGLRAGAYMHWSIDQIVTRYPPSTQPAEVVAGLCARMSQQYSDLHEALKSGDAARFGARIALLYDDARVAFQQMAERYPAVIEP